MEKTFKDKVILVTGGCGSIGSQIVRTLLAYEPYQIRIFDNRETEMFRIEQELGAAAPVRYLIGDVRDKDRVKVAMEGVDYVFHAAALKHVPLCEYSPFEAVKTNVHGTQNVVEAALDTNVERVINISTDKVTNAISTMGATKLLTERLMTAAEFCKGLKRTLFASVRFGNVMGTNGSVIEVFKRQIEDGGPITITDPNMTRFIMSIPHAVKLVVKAALSMQGGELFILKMPVFRLDDLTEVIIEETLPQREGVATQIKTEIVGLRLGEKRYEDLLTEEEAQIALETDEFFIVPSPIELAQKKQDYKQEKKDITLYSSKDVAALDKKALKQFLKEENLL